MRLVAVTELLAVQCSSSSIRFATLIKSGPEMSGGETSGNSTFPGREMNAPAHPACIAPRMSQAWAATKRRSFVLHQVDRPPFRRLLATA